MRNFQRDNGLAVDGIAGPRTLSALGISSGSSGSGQYSSNDVYLLAKVIAAEARGEPYTGQVAVGAVVLNRVSHASFPDSIPAWCTSRGHSPAYGLELGVEALRRGEKGGARRHQRLGPDRRRDILL